MISARSLRGLAVVVLAALAGCAGETFAPDDAPVFAVKAARAPLYRLGPQQAAPPDVWLESGETVRLLRREFGYSFALLPNGQTGYIANDDLEPAPADLLPPPARATGAAPVPVEPPLPEPDLEAMPGDAPGR